MSSRRLNVFLSSTGKDLADHRAAIARHLAASDAFHLVHSETFGARSRGAVAVCRERVRECDVLVGLIGHYRGWEPDGDNTQRSITEMEYDWAAEHGLERLMYVLPDGGADPAALGPAMTSDAAGRQGLFRSRVLACDLHDKRVHDGEFVDPGHLAAAVVTGLKNLLYGRMLEAIRAAGGAPQSADTPGDASPVTPSPEAALLALANDPDLDQLLADPGTLDMRQVEAAVAHRAETRAAHAREARAKADADLSAAAQDYARLGALSYGIDAAKAYRYFALAAETGAADGMTLYWMAETALAAGKSAPAISMLEAAVERLDDSEDARGAFWAFTGLGDLRVAAGDLALARDAYQTARDIAARAAQLQPDAAGWQRDLSVSHNNIGDVLRAQGALPAALDSYRASLAIRERLARSDPGNAGWQRDLSVSHDRIGDMLRAQGALPAALDGYRASLAIRERLARSDPGHAGWQRDLSVSHDRIGDVLVAQGNLPAALDGYRAGLAIAERLARSDPGNAEWQRDLSVSHNKIGDVLVAQGALPAALESYRASLAIRERLARSDPGNAEWQADLAASHGKLGQLHVRLGDNGEARRYFEAGRAIVAPFAERSGHQLWIGYLHSFDAELAALGK